MAKEKITGAEAMMRSLEYQGVKTLFGYPGGSITAAHCFFIHIFLFFARLHHTRNTGLSVPSKHLRRNKGAVMPTKTISTLQNIFFHKKTGLSNSPDQNTNPQSPAMPPFHDNATMPAPPIKTTAAAENRNGRIKREYAPPFSGEETKK